ncbi:MAG: hypothetical protein R3C44_09540 [Chloroflexota bacterium]
MAASEELKTKPTQHSVRELRSIGIRTSSLLAPITLSPTSIRQRNIIVY